MSQHTTDTSRPPPSLPAGFVGRAVAARISGIGITAWKRWEIEGKVTCGQWLTMPGGGRCRIYPIDAVQQMMRELDLSFPPPGTVDRHEAARMFGVGERTFSEWEKQGRITCGRSVSIPGQPGQYKCYPVEELQRLADAFRRQEEEAARRLQPYADPGRPGVVRVPVLSEKHKGMETIIDADDVPLVQGKRWNWSGGSSESNRRAECGSVVLSGPGAPLARIIMSVTDPLMLVSHVNGDRLDHRRANLIVRTRSEVKRASKKVMVKAGKVCSSRFKGVTRTGNGRKWQVTMTVGGASTATSAGFAARSMRPLRTTPRCAS